MNQVKTITIISNRKKIVLGISTILYVITSEKNAEIHVSGGTVYPVRMTMKKLEEELGEGFIKVHRGCLVSVMAIHDITDHVNLVNGESLIYTLRKKNQIIGQFHEGQKKLFHSFKEGDIPRTEEEFREHFKSFETLPFAFTDIEMILDEENHAVDWIFRYGNEALAKLEKKPLDQLIGSSFGSVFSNMDSKWLKFYERVALYSDTLELMDYSPEIDTYLKIICFPTFPGHCGCILFNISNITYTQNSMDAEKAMMLYFGEQWDKEKKSLQK